MNHFARKYRFNAENKEYSEKHYKKDVRGVVQDNHMKNKDNRLTTKEYFLGNINCSKWSSKTYKIQ